MKVQYQIRPKLCGYLPFFRRYHYAFQLFFINNLHGQNDKIPATLAKSQYNCQVINNILRINVLQTFSSRSDKEFSETQYLFPISDEICLESFTAKYQDKTIKGLIKTKEEALKEYITNKNEGNLVSYAELKTDSNEDYIKIKLGNLPPNEEVHITMTYSQQLSTYLNKYYMVSIPVQIANDDISVKLGQHLLKLDISCPGRILHAESTEGKKLAQRTMIDENNVQFTLNQVQNEAYYYFRVLFSYEGMFEPQILYGDSKIFNEDSVKSALIPPRQSVMVTFLPDFNKNITQELDDALKASLTNGEDILSDQFEDRVNEEVIDHLKSSKSEYLFLLDRSSSMRGKPLEKAIEALKLFLQSLPNNSYFNIISFGSTFAKLYQKSQKYNSQTLKYSIEKLSKFSANMGGTEILNPLRGLFQEQRIRGYNKQIFILTDGAVQNRTDVIRLIRRNNKFNRVHLIGFGSSVDKYLIQESALAGKGIFQLTTFEQDLSGVIIKMLSQTISPTLDNFTITYNEDVFESTFPNTSKIQCFFKDEVFYLHLFLKPLVKLELLSDEQKTITLKYHDSSMKLDVIKQIKLESSDQFTCNQELRESVYKLGKYLQITDQIENGEGNIQYAEQQALDFQLLTKLTAMICVIQKINDEQRATYESLPKSFYSQSETFNDVYYENQQEIQKIYHNNLGILQRLSSSSNSNHQVQRNKCSLISLHQEKTMSETCNEKSINQPLSIAAKPQIAMSAKRPTSALSSLVMKKSEKNTAKTDQLGQLGTNKQEKINIDIKRSNTNFIQDTKNNEVKNQQSVKMINDEDMKLQEESKQNNEEITKEYQQQLEIEQKYMKLEAFLSLADSEGVWKYDEKLIKKFASKKFSSLNSLALNIKNKDLFMTLFFICILEQLYSSQKQKWILISKKSLSFVKEQISIEELKNLKQSIINNIE